jgi:hypothetical protein
MIDWTAIQAEYEAGNFSSIRALAARYQVPLTTLYDRSRHWQTPEHRTPNTEHDRGDTQTPRNLRMMHPELPSPKNAIDGANLGINSLVVYMQQNSRLMDPTEHSKAAQALTLYNRILINATPDEQAGPDEAREDFSSFTDDELALYAELQERAREKQRGA